MSSSDESGSLPSRSASRKLGVSPRLSVYGIAVLVLALSGCARSRPAPPVPEAAPAARATTDSAAAAAEAAPSDHADPSWTPSDAQALEALDAAMRAAESRGQIARGVRAAIPPGAAAAAEVRPLLQIFVFDLGQADSMLIVGPTGKTLLVDLGERRGGTKPNQFTSGREAVLERINDITGGSSIDYFVVSHYHSDHTGLGGDADNHWGSGIIGLLSDYSVPFYVDDFIHVGDDGAEYMGAESGRSVYKTIKTRVPLWQSHGRVGRSEAPRFGIGQIDLGAGVRVDILAFAGKVPDGSAAQTKAEHAGVDYSHDPANENDLSVVLRITAGKFEMFTGGDLNGTDDPLQRPLYVRRVFGSDSEIYTNVEHHLVDYWKTHNIESDVEVYRADHHGSEYSNTAKLIDALDPEFVVYSSGAQYGHPSGAAVQRGKQTARQLATTDVAQRATFSASKGEVAGEIRIVVERGGEAYSIHGERHRAFSDAEEAAGDDVGDEDHVVP